MFGTCIVDLVEIGVEIVDDFVGIVVQRVVLEMDMEYLLSQIHKAC